MFVLPHGILPKFMCLCCHTAYLPNTYICTATQHFSQFICTYCPTEFFPVQMFEFPHGTLPKFSCLYCHTKFFNNSEICVATHHVSRIQMFLLQYTSFPNSDVCIATQYAFSHRTCCKRGAIHKISIVQEKQKGVLFFYPKQML
jgi:hypothetical protein